MRPKPRIKEIVLICSLVANVFVGGLLFLKHQDPESVAVASLSGKIAPSEQELSQLNSTPYAAEWKIYGAEASRPAKRILFVGNSISLHAVLKEIGWTHVSGMAASSDGKDYVHVLVRLLSADSNLPIEYAVINIADFERAYDVFDYHRLDDVARHAPDIVIFQIGENVPNSKVTEGFENAYVFLVTKIKAKSTVICLPLWSTREKNRVITDVALKTNGYLVDLSHLRSGVEPLNAARAERKFSNPGVAGHPGDFGMENIAKSLFTVTRHLVAPK